MTTHKTFGGMIKAVDRMVAALGASRIEDRREYDRINREVHDLLDELNCLWSNPADVDEAAKAKNRLLAAWHDATN